MNVTRSFSLLAFDGRHDHCGSFLPVMKPLSYHGLFLETHRKPWISYRMTIYSVAGVKLWSKPWFLPCHRFSFIFLHQPILGTGKKNDKHDEPLDFCWHHIFLTTSHETGVAGVARCKANLWGNGTAQNLQTIPGIKAKSGIWDYLGIKIGVGIPSAKLTHHK